MNESMLINGKTYRYKCNYKDDEALRNSFNELTEKTYGFHFKQWYEDGYWKDNYTPYSLLDGDKVVANVSVNIMDFNILEEQKRCIQIGTVMTDEEYRGRGLSKALMEVILKEWEHKCDLIYLFANDSVLDFYPKFGFSRCTEYQYAINKSGNDRVKKVKKLNMDNKKEREMLYEMACNTLSFAKVAMSNYPSLIMFYCTYFMRDNIYYLEDYETVVICDVDKDTLYVNEVLSTKEVSLDAIINEMTNEKTKKVVLGFTPKDSSPYDKHVLEEEDTTLFIKVGKGRSFELGDSMFPLLSHA